MDECSDCNFIVAAGLSYVTAISGEGKGSLFLPCCGREPGGSAGQSDFSFLFFGFMLKHFSAFLLPPVCIITCLLQGHTKAEKYEASLVSL